VVVVVDGDNSSIVARVLLAEARITRRHILVVRDRDDGPSTVTLAHQAVSSGLRNDLGAFRNVLINTRPFLACASRDALVVAGGAIRRCDAAGGSTAGASIAAGATAPSPSRSLVNDQVSVNRGYQLAAGSRYCNPAKQ